MKLPCMHIIVVFSVQACDTYMYMNIVYSCTCVLIDRCVKVRWYKWAKLMNKIPGFMNRCSNIGLQQILFTTV